VNDADDDAIATHAIVVGASWHWRLATAIARSPRK
jgi:hypothetical protein